MRQSAEELLHGRDGSGGFLVVTGVWIAESTASRNSKPLLGGSWILITHIRGLMG